jgi:Histidine phosphatase superfamily (branch 2)
LAKELAMEESDFEPAQGLLQGGRDVGNESVGKPRVNFDLDENQGNSGRKGRYRVLQHRRSVGGEPKLIKFVFILVIPATILLSLFFILSKSSGSSSRDAVPKTAPTGSKYQTGFDITNNWGSISPYFDSGAAFKGIDLTKTEGEYGLPSYCSYKQVHVLHRHAERYPTSGTGRMMKEVAEKIYAMDEPPIKELSWLETWNYTMGEDLLVPKGVGTEFASGAQFWSTHGRFLYKALDASNHLFYDKALNVFENGTSRPLPVLRATTQSRIQTSARAWAAGFFGIYGGQPYSAVDDYGSGELYKLVLMAEEQGTNNTLAADYSCPNSDNSSYEIGKSQSKEWINIYLKDAAVRLQTVLPGFSNLTAQDAYGIQSLCSFETAAYGKSSFCELFTETEWRGFEYAADLSFFGRSSYGSLTSKGEGIGWISELLARLEGRLITEAGNGVNVTLTGSEETFPIGQPFYLDMTHDSVLVAVLTAMGLDFLEKELPVNNMPVPRQFIVSRLTPFGARLYVEVLDCVDDTDVASYVRLKLNNRVLPLKGLKNCPSSADGLCKLDKFIDSLKHQVKVVNFDHVCYEDLSDELRAALEQR